MLCPACQKEIAPPAAACPHCAVPLGALGAPSGREVLTSFVPSSPESIKRSQAMVYVTLACVFYAACIFLNYRRVLVWAGIMNAESSGFMLGGCFGAFLLGLLVPFIYSKARRKRLSAPQWWFFASIGALFFTLLASFGTHEQHPTLSQADINRELRDVMNQTLGKAPPSAHPEWRQEPVRGFYNDLVKTNVQYQQELSALDTSDLNKMYSAQSYASRAKMQKTLEELQSVRAVDQKYASLDPVYDAMRVRIWSANVSNKEKDEFLTGFNKSIHTSMAPRDETFTKARAWIDASSDLYQFMLANQRNYTIRDGKLVFQTADTLSEFKEKQSHAIECRKELNEARSNFKSYQAKTLQQLGLSPSDFSPPTNSPSPAAPTH